MVELCNVTSLEVVAKNNLISLQIIHREAEKLHEFAGITRLLVAIERDWFKELSTVYSELSGV